MPRLLHPLTRAIWRRFRLGRVSSATDPAQQRGGHVLHLAGGYVVSRDGARLLYQRATEG